MPVATDFCVSGRRAVGISARQDVPEAAARSERSRVRRITVTSRARRLKVETLLAVVIVVQEQTAEPPPWHLRCRCCGEFALVQAGSLARASPACVAQGIR